MSKTITYDVPDELFAAFEQMAIRADTTPDAIALQWLARRTRAQTKELNAETRHAELEKLMRCAGSVDSGDSCSGDNERIDRDLVREYAGTHIDE